MLSYELGGRIILPFCSSECPLPFRAYEGVQPLPLLANTHPKPVLMTAPLLLKAEVICPQTPSANHSHHRRGKGTAPSHTLLSPSRCTAIGPPYLPAPHPKWYVSLCEWQQRPCPPTLRSSLLLPLCCQSLRRPCQGVLEHLCCVMLGHCPMVCICHCVTQF